jgi:HD superfamily phosphodiesterase
MKNNNLEKLINNYNKGDIIIDCNDDYEKKIKNIETISFFHNHINQIDINEILTYFKKNNLFQELIDNVKDIKTEYLYKSYRHGINHNLRVLFFTIYLANILKLSKEDTQLMLTAAKYHDIGRNDDVVDNYHGQRSANKIKEIISNDDCDIPLLQGIIELHSIDDNNFDLIVSKYKIKDIEKFRLLYSILKDADALDRVRLSYGEEDRSSLNPNMLRLEASRNLIKAAHQLNEYFEKNK